MASSTWALNQISRLLPLEEESLKQILDYTLSLPETEAADYLRNLLGDTPQTLEFISSFNARHKSTAVATQNVASTSDASQSVPRAPKAQKKKKAPLNNLPPPRRPDDYGNVGSGYQKKRYEEEYMSASSRQPPSRKDATVSNPFSLTTTPTAQQRPRATLDPFMPNVLTRTSSPSKSAQVSGKPSPANTPSRTSSPRPASNKQKILIPGGTPMHGARSTLSDLESAIRTLEMSTNPTLAHSDVDNKARACPCIGSIHPVLTAAPNCLACGKIVCTKEGLAPCTFCGTPLLTPTQIQEMVHTLREERGREKMAVNNAAQGQRGGGGKAAATSASPQIAAGGATGGDAEGDAVLAKAMAHRDKLLNFQASNARRTQVVDEAAAFETPDTGVSHWASAEERAQQLKKQQRVLREMEWNARPEWEKRRVVVSVDLVGGKVVRRMQEIGAPAEEDRENEGKVMEEEVLDQSADAGNPVGGGGAFAKNPLLGEMVKPIWRRIDEKWNAAEDLEGQKGERRRETTHPWRRVQDDADDNEEIILNGGIYGGRESERIFAEEPACR